MKAEYKIPNGKLLACEVEYDGKITELKISGDFFMHPESAIVDLEAVILGKTTDELEEAVSGFFSESDIQLVGVAPLDFVKVIELALSP